MQLLLLTLKKVLRVDRVGSYSIYLRSSEKEKGAYKNWGKLRRVVII